MAGAMYVVGLLDLLLFWEREEDENRRGGSRTEQ